MEIHSAIVQRGYADEVLQLTLPSLDEEPRSVAPFKTQLLKWIGNKQRFAHEIIECFPHNFGTYFEPFLGSGAVLATLAPERAVAADAFWPLIDIFVALHERPNELRQWYRSRWELMNAVGKKDAYERVRASYNARPNAADLLYLSRACYGGVIRFRKDGHMSTPCGAHSPIAPESFSRRVSIWSQRTAGARFLHQDFRDTMAQATAGDLIYCDPPYSDTQSIIYGAQAFDLADLVESIADCKRRGVLVALSIDGSKASGRTVVEFDFPRGLFEREVAVNCGRSMLKRFQMAGNSLEHEVVTDRLLLTY
ncbi:DNA adenine methylase [Candidatus Poriferisodalis sp.]|uniref:DNA adenine methylase n=1 Tax=Candidatus Poriferisodalis sp. TaxID=3101277 RepID=UPI003B020BDE